jgi:peptidoglycan/LPS O-acetylase OafA/YrhL
VITFSASLVFSLFQYYGVEKPVQGALTRWLLFGWNSHSRRAKDKVKAGE